MSVEGLLTMRGTVRRAVTTDAGGTPAVTWVDQAVAVPCRLDLLFIRAGKDPTWTSDAGRAPDRTGVLFVKAGTDVRPGDHIVITQGAPLGITVEVDGWPDSAFGFSTTSHLELQVREVAQSIAQA